MSRAALSACAGALALLTFTVGASADAPRISAQTALSAAPAAASNGGSGPVNRYGFDLLNFAPDDPTARVLCIYSGFAYRCRHEFDAGTNEPRRITVEIPDIDKGLRVVVRFSTARGAAQKELTLANAPRVIHEIETLALTRGGASATGGDGAPAADRQLVRETATTAPALAMTVSGAEPACDQLYAQWISATATDPVFISAFGALNGAVAPAGDIRSGARVDRRSLPQWLVTYPRSATRAQFIAHYEVVYRVGVCAERVVHESQD